MASAEIPVQPKTLDQPKETRGPFSLKLILLNLLLILSTLAVYAPVRHYPFVNYDDPWYVAKNPYIQHGITPAMLSWAFLERGYCHNWHPVTWISHALDIELFGLDPGPHHDVNVLLHVLNALLLFWMLRSATGYVGRSFMVAALFALHPINVESVAWLSERKTLLSMVFFVLVFVAYRWFSRKPTDGRYALVALLYVLGLMAKPQVITLPLLLLLWDYWPLQRMAIDEAPSEAPAEILPPVRFWRLVSEKIPLLVIGAGSALLTMLAQEVGKPQTWPYTLAIRLGNAIFSYAWYVVKALWPTNLAPFYPHPGNLLSVGQVLLALSVLLLVTALILRARRHRYLVVGWFWFLIALLPMIGIIQVWEQARADRYAYQAFVGLFILVCWGVGELTDRLRVPAPVITVVAAIVLLSLGIAARNQTRYWADSIAIWTRSLEVTPSNNFVGESSLAYVLTLAGRPADAVPHVTKALALRPNDPLNNLEAALYEQRQGDLPAAVEHYKRVLAAPDSVPAQKHLALTNLARAYNALGDAQQARQCLNEAASLPGSDSAQP